MGRSLEFLRQIFVGRLFVGHVLSLSTAHLGPWEYINSVPGWARGRRCNLLLHGPGSATLWRRTHDGSWLRLRRVAPVDRPSAQHEGVLPCSGKTASHRLASAPILRWRRGERPQDSRAGWGRVVGVRLRYALETLAIAIADRSQSLSKKIKVPQMKG